MCNSHLTFSTSKYSVSQQGRWKMTEASSSLPFEKRGNEGGSAFFITVSPALGQLLDLSKSN